MRAAGSGSTDGADLRTGSGGTTGTPTAPPALSSPPLLLLVLLLVDRRTGSTGTARSLLASRRAGSVGATRLLRLLRSEDVEETLRMLAEDGDGGGSGYASRPSRPRWGSCGGAVFRVGSEGGASRRVGSGGGAVVFRVGNGGGGGFFPPAGAGAGAAMRCCCSESSCSRARTDGDAVVSIADIFLVLA